MKVSREQATENRGRIVDVAANAFRKHGFDGIGVADLMKQAGMTHGGFYGHFAAKDELMAEAVSRAIATSVERWKAMAAAAPDAPLAAVTAPYLSATHLAHPDCGCAFPALGADIARQDGKVRHAATEGLRAQIDLLASLIPGKSAAARQDKAMAAFASMVGAVVLARSADDPALAEAILRAAAADLPRDRRTGTAAGTGTSQGKAKAG